MNYLYAFILGTLSIISPCTFIMVPVILNKIEKSFADIIYFLFGVIFVFMILGVVASLTGVVFTLAINQYLYLFAGIVTMISGLGVLGAIKIEYPKIEDDRQFTGSFFDGLLHGGATLGCIGPQLAAFLTFIIVQRNLVNGLLMTISFALGFSFPFFLFGMIITDKSVQRKLMGKVLLITRTGGILMIGAACYLLYFALKGFT